MTAKAYLLGADTLGLEYAAKDAQRMEQALRVHGYETAFLPAISIFCTEA